MRSSLSTPNSFVFLELGVLPIEYEIHIKQFVFLHKFLNISEDNPVLKMYHQQLLYPAEDNWANKLDKMRKKYDLPKDDDLAKMSKYSWKNMVNKVVTNFAFKLLVEKCKAMSKTSHLQYQDTFKIQRYLVSYPFDVANVVFKLRGRSTNCLTNRGDDGDCRVCGVTEESQNHCINCPDIFNDNGPISLATLYGEVASDDKEVMEIVDRFNRFEAVAKLKQ